jgi:hypothetical protein
VLIADGKASCRFGLAIEDAQEMFQRNNVLYVYVHVYACWGCGPDPAYFYFMLWAAFAPGETMKGEWLYPHASCENDNR